MPTPTDMGSLWTDALFHLTGSYAVEHPTVAPLLSSFLPRCKHMHSASTLRPRPVLTFH